MSTSPVAASHRPITPGDPSPAPPGEPPQPSPRPEPDDDPPPVRAPLSADIEEVVRGLLSSVPGARRRS